MLGQELTGNYEEKNVLKLQIILYYKNYNFIMLR